MSFCWLFIPISSQWGWLNFSLFFFKITLPRTVQSDKELWSIWDKMVFLYHYLPCQMWHIWWTVRRINLEWVYSSRQIRVTQGLTFSLQAIILCILAIWLKTIFILDWANPARRDANTLRCLEGKVQHVGLSDVACVSTVFFFPEDSLGNNGK